FEPLTQEHLAIKGNQTAAVSLTGVTHHCGVNALASEQTVTFGPNLTIVFGWNAAGKSGYARILKRACRSRSVENILGNVLNQDPPLNAKVTMGASPESSPTESARYLHRSGCSLIATSTNYPTPFLAGMDGTSFYPTHVPLPRPDPTG